jgi:hypothetical protein
MSKTLELHGVYETRGGEWTAEVVCVDIGKSHALYPCVVIYTNKTTGIKTCHTATKEGKVLRHHESEYNLIIPNPEPKLRPWKVEEIPVGARVRRKDYRVCETLILGNLTAIAGEEPYLIFLDGRSSAKGALEELEYFNGTTWQPCGVLE